MVMSARFKCMFVACNWAKDGKPKEEEKEEARALKKIRYQVPVDLIASLGEIRETPCIFVTSHVYFSFA